jgi:hypothetical protein
MKLHLLLIYLFVLTGVATAQTGNEPRSVSELFGKNGLQIITNADTVSAVLLKQDRKGKVRERVRRVELPAEAQRAAVKLVSANASYDWNIWKPCLPEYGTRLLFRRGDDTITVDFCFACDILSVSPAGRHESRGYFDPSSAAWLRFFRDQFPRDKTLRKVGG